MKNWWLRTCAHLHTKIFQKSVIFVFFSFDLCTDIILKQLNKIKNTVFFVFFTFHFSLLFPVLFPPLCFPIVVPLYYPVALPRCWVEVLEPTVAKTDDLGLVPIFKKNISKICDFRFFSFDLCTGIILKQLNKIKNLIYVVFSLFIFLCCFSWFFSRCASLLWSLLSYRVVHPHCGATGDCRGDRELLAFIFHQHARARWRKTLTPTRCIGITRPGETPRGDTTGKQNGETQWKNENEKK